MWIVAIIAIFILICFIIQIRIFRKQITLLQTQNKNLEQQTKLIQQQMLAVKFTTKTKLIEETYKSLDRLRKEIDINRVEQKAPEKVLDGTIEKIFTISGKLAQFMKELKEV